MLWNLVFVDQIFAALIRKIWAHKTN